MTLDHAGYGTSFPPQQLPCRPLGYRWVSRRMPMGARSDLQPSPSCFLPSFLPFRIFQHDQTATYFHALTSFFHSLLANPEVNVFCRSSSSHIFPLFLSCTVYTVLFFSVILLLFHSLPALICLLTLYFPSPCASCLVALCLVPSLYRPPSPRSSALLVFASHSLLLSSLLHAQTGTPPPHFLTLRYLHTCPPELRVV